MKSVFVSLFVALVSTVPISAGADAPDSAQQRLILQKVREAAARYLEGLPNFVCSRVTEQYEAGKKPDHWRQGVTLTDRLIFNKGKENISPELLNGKPIAPGRYIDRPLETSGEFGDLVSTILDEQSAARFSWSRWEDLSGRHLAVFEYVVDGQHSTLTLGITGLDAILPYRGLLYADPETGELWRITSSPFAIPAAVETKSLVTTIDYGSVEIANKHFILPVSASIMLDTGRRNIMNKVSFTQYRKFEAESKITFVSGSN